MWVGGNRIREGGGRRRCQICSTRTVLKHKLQLQLALFPLSPQYTKKKLIWEKSALFGKSISDFLLYYVCQGDKVGSYWISFLLVRLPTLSLLSWVVVSSMLQCPVLSAQGWLFILVVCTFSHYRSDRRRCRKKRPVKKKSYRLQIQVSFRPRSITALS